MFSDAAIHIYLGGGQRLKGSSKNSFFLLSMYAKPINEHIRGLKKGRIGLQKILCLVL